MGIYRRKNLGVTLSNRKFQRFMIFILTFVVLFCISALNVIPKKYDFKAGDIAPVDIKAPREFIDERATETKIQEAISKVQSIYDRDETIEKSAVASIIKYFDKSLELKTLDIDDNSKINKLKSETSLKLSNEDYLLTLSLSSEQITQLSRNLSDILSKILKMEIKEDNIDDLRRAQEDLRFYIRNNSNPMSKSMNELGENIGISLIKANARLNMEATEDLKKEAKKQVEPVIFKKNQNIILKGEVITEDQLYILNKAGLLQKNFIADITIYFAIGVLILITQLLIALLLKKFRHELFENNSMLSIIAIVLCVMAIFTTGTNVISQFLMPSSFIVILMCLIFDPLVAFVVGIPSVFLITCIVNFNSSAILLFTIGCISGIYFSYNAHQRNNVLFCGLTTGALNAIVILSVSLINNVDIRQGVINSIIGLGGGFLSAILSIGILPVFEQFFDIITPIKLLELSNPNQPLLKKLLFEAPGTYHHSILVGNMAEAASEEVGANSILARVGAYYHDVGKIKRPYFFKENQITNDNPHDKITPKLSSLIITSHVKDGLELADKYRLPKAVKEIIEQHHGTTLVRYFYVMAAKDGKEIVEETAFRYEGPKPISKEIAIVMLADSVEAAVRSLNNPTINDIENMVNKIVNEKVDDGQLDNSDLTLKDLEKIKKSFVKVLVGIFHSRIEYPELEDENKGEDNI